MIVHRNCEIRLTPEGTFSVRKQSDGYVFSRRFDTTEDAVAWLDKSLADAAPLRVLFRNAGVNARSKHTRGMGGGFGKQQLSQKADNHSTACRSGGLKKKTE